MRWQVLVLFPCAVLLLPGPVQRLSAQERKLDGVIPRAQKPVQLDGALDDWTGAFVTPVHVGHPNFTNRGAEFLYLWDEQNLYIGLRCLDQKPAHVAPDTQIYNGDAVEFYLDTRSGQDLGGNEFAPGTLHMFWTPFTGSEIKPRLQVRPLPVFKDFQLQGAQVAAQKTPWGWTAEFRLPWKNFPSFSPKVGAILGMDCELCSSDGGVRVDRTFVYSSPRSVATPVAFGRVQLAEQDSAAYWNKMGRALLPLNLNRSTNYPWLYATAGLSPTIASKVSRLEGRIRAKDGKVHKTMTGALQRFQESPLTLWRGEAELYDLPAGEYTLELQALDKQGQQITVRMERFVQGN
jgi:hypothetical protein